ncbi:MAG TPA: hypothetical protein VII73_13790 [Caulobacteraceae bacterium]
MDDPSSPSGRHADGRFANGHKGGRRHGSRNRVSHRVLMAIFDDFEAHKAELLNRLRVTYTPDYFRTLARLAPSMLADDRPEFENHSDAEASRLVSRLRQVLAATENPRRALVELEGVLESDLAARDAS